MDSLGFHFSSLGLVEDVIRLRLGPTAQYPKELESEFIKRVKEFQAEALQTGNSSVAVLRDQLLNKVEEYMGEVESLSCIFWEHDRYHKDHVEVSEIAEVALNLEDAWKLVKALKAFPPKITMAGTGETNESEEPEREANPLKRERSPPQGPPEGDPGPAKKFNKFVRLRRPTVWGEVELDPGVNEGDKPYGADVAPIPKHGWQASSSSK